MWKKLPYDYQFVFRKMHFLALFCFFVPGLFNDFPKASLEFEKYFSYNWSIMESEELNFSKVDYSPRSNAFVITMFNFRKPK